MLSDFIVTLLVTQAVLLTVCSLYCYAQDVYKHKLDRKFWIYVQENRFNDVMQQEYDYEQADRDEEFYSNLAEIEEAQLYESN